MVVSAQTVCGLGSIASQGSPQGSQDPRGRTSRAAVRSPLERGPRRWRIRPRSKERNQARVGTKLAAASRRATSRRPPRSAAQRAPASITTASPTRKAFSRVFMGAFIIAGAGQRSRDLAGSRASQQTQAIETARPRSGSRDQPIGARRAQPARGPGAIGSQGSPSRSQAHRGWRRSPTAGGRP
jgi:hypothetical protein